MSPSLVPTRRALAGLVAILVLSVAAPVPLGAATRREIDRDATAALNHLLAHTPAAKTLAREARAILIFPKIVKAGFMVGGAYGEGVLRKGGKSAGYYASTAASYGLQAGIQSYGYALFLMTEQAVSYLDRSDGWELGVGPSIVVLDQGGAASLTTTTARSDAYAFFFDQKGLMGGIGIQGSKVTRIRPK